MGLLLPELNLDASLKGRNNSNEAKMLISNLYSLTTCVHSAAGRSSDQVIGYVSLPVFVELSTQPATSMSNQGR